MAKLLKDVADQAKKDVLKHSNMVTREPAKSGEVEHSVTPHLGVVENAPPQGDMPAPTTNQDNRPNHSASEGNLPENAAQQDGTAFDWGKFDINEKPPTSGGLYLSLNKHYESVIRHIAKTEKRSLRQITAMLITPTLDDLKQKLEKGESLDLR